MFESVSDEIIVSPWQNIDHRPEDGLERNILVQSPFVNQNLFDLIRSYLPQSAPEHVVPGAPPAGSDTKKDEGAPPPN